MRRRHFLAAAGATALAALAGCATHVGGEPPSVTVADLQLVEATLFEQKFALKLRVLNPNDWDIPIDGLSFTLELNGKDFARGVSNKPVVVPRFGEAVIDATAVVGIGGVLRQLNDLMENGTASARYRLHGRLHGGGIGGIPFESSGELKLPEPAGGTRR